MAFKMKRTPMLKKGGLREFFSSLGRKGTEKRQEKQVRENQGMTNFEKRRAEKKSRKAGESKFQADARRKKERKAATASGDAKNAADKKAREAATAKLNAEIVSSKGKEKVVKKPNSKITGAIGSKTRKEQYDAKGWKYDDTIKGYNKDGSRKKFVVQTDVTKNKKGVRTPNNKSFNTAEEQNAFIAANKGSFEYKIDDKSNRIKKEKEKKTNNPPPTNIATEETVKKDSNVLTQVLKPGFMHASDMINKGFAKPGVGFDFNKTNDYSSPVEKNHLIKKV